MKCQQCDKETDLPFRCSYCQGYFCTDHKLPENHQCPNLPKQPKFWYQKKRLTEKQTLFAESKLGACPKCSAMKSEMIDYNAKTMTFKCENCGHKWTQSKSSPHRMVEPEIVQPRVEPKQEREPRKPKKAAKSHILAFSIILMVVIPVVAYASYIFGYDVGSGFAYTKGFNEGYVSGNSTGYNVGYNYGYFVGNESGRQEGYNIGYVQGVTDGAGRGYNIRDPTYQEVLQFKSSDQTDENAYDEENYNCFHYTADFESNAYKAGYRCGLVYIKFVDSAHAIACFNTTDRGLIFVEPQDDDIVTLAIGQQYWDRSKYAPTYDDTILRFMIVW